MISSKLPQIGHGILRLSVSAQTVPTLGHTFLIFLVSGLSHLVSLSLNNTLEIGRSKLGFPSLSFLSHSNLFVSFRALIQFVVICLFNLYYLFPLLEFKVQIYLL